MQSEQKRQPIQLWSPQDGPQLAAIDADWADEIFFGGERGGGKSDFQLGYQQDGAFRYGTNWRGIMFRKTYPEMEELQGRAMQIFGDSGGTFKSQQSAGFPFSNCWYWESGASVKMRYIENEKDYGRYHGHQYTGISFDEVTEYPTPTGLLKMLSTLRSAAGVPCTVRLTGNPGGVGHIWVKSRYIDQAPPLTPYKDPETGFTRMFIPSKLSDNAILLQNDPMYRNRIMAATGGNEALRKAWLEGDWNIVAGAFFDCWSPKMVLHPFAIPEEWTRFRSGDWGSARPYAFHWWAVVQETYDLPDGQILPRGAMVGYREIYGAKDRINQPNVGTKEDAESIGARITALEKGEKVSYGVLDPAAFASDGGPSIAERLFRGSGNKVIFRKADNARVALRGAMGGWDQMRARMKGEDGRPMLYLFSTCIDSIRTIPLLQHDADRLEDVDCWVAGTMVETPDGPRAIETIKAGDLVDTPIGARPVLRSYLSGVGSTIWANLSDGSRLQGTPHHKIYIRGKGLVALENIECHDIPRRRNTAWQKRLLNIAASFTHAMTGGFTTTQTAQFLARVGQAFIAKCGLMQGARFLTAGTFTTRTTTTTTMPWTISSAFLQASTGDCTSENEWVKSRPSLPSGAQQMGESKPFAITLARCTHELRGVHLRAPVVAVLLKLDTLQKSIAPLSALLKSTRGKFGRIAKSVGLSFGPSATRQKKSAPVHIVAVGRSDERTNVYNLTVAGAHLFYANGFLSSNTDMEDHAGDSARYACMSRPYRAQIETKEEPRFLHEATMNEVMWPQGQGKGAQSNRRI